MPHKHPTDRQAYRRWYYREHRDALKDKASEWYEENRGTSEYKLRKANYMVIYRRRKKQGL